MDDLTLLLLYLVLHELRKRRELVAGR